MSLLYFAALLDHIHWDDALLSESRTQSWDRFTVTYFESAFFANPYAACEASLCRSQI